MAVESRGQVAAGEPADRPPGSAAPNPAEPGDRIRGAALRRSLHYNVVAWLYGSVWMAAVGGGTITELARHLGASDFVFSLLMAAPLVGVWFQIPGTLLIRWAGQRRRVILGAGVPHRALYCVMGLLPWVVPGKAGWGATALAFLLVVSSGLGNLMGQAWMHWMSDLVPARMQGKYFARRTRLGILMTGLTGLAAGLLLDLARTRTFGRWVAPVTGFDPDAAAPTGMPPVILMISAIFVLAGLMGVKGAWTYRRKIVEPVLRPGPREPVLRNVLRPLRDGVFLRYIAFFATWTLGQSLCGWMWWLFLLEVLRQVSQEGVWWQGHLYLAAYLLLPIPSQLGSWVGYTVWGAAVDRFGRKSVFFVSSTLGSLLWIPWIFLGPTMLPWLALTQFVSGLVIGGQDVAHVSMMLEFNRKGGPGYNAAAQAVFALVGFAGLALGGSFSDLLGREFGWEVLEGTAWSFTFRRYAVLAMVGVLLKSLADFGLLPLVQDLKARPRRQAARYVLGNLPQAVYGNLEVFVLGPLRALPQQFEELRKGWR